MAVYTCYYLDSYLKLLAKITVMLVSVWQVINRTQFKTAKTVVKIFAVYFFLASLCQGRAGLVISARVYGLLALNLA